MTRLADTHTHLQHQAFDDDREQVLDRALGQLAWLLVIGDDLDSSKAAAAMAGGRVSATAGIHPHNVGQSDDESLSALRELARGPGIVAIGEIGLDYHYDLAPRDRQREAFRAQLELAAGLGLPVVVHCREAIEDTAAIIEPMHKGLAGGVMHCFGGDAAFAERCLSWGFHVSFAGNVTFPKADALREAAVRVPMDRLLVETDCPYLAPQPVRGKRCEPINVHHTAELLAGLKEVSAEAFAEQTTANAARLFGVRDLGASAGG